MAASLGCLLVVMTSTAYATTEITTVPSVDLRRYAGLWFEIAHLPFRYEKHCASDITATYTLKSNGTVQVVNACRSAKGKVKEAKGTAKVASKKGPNSKLKVTFFWPFYGDYWILDLDPDYRWAMVGTPDRKYLWFLSRTPRISEELYRKLAEDAREKGFATTRLIRTRHNTQ
jgi:apolipoprotein D and lipocalin family protein